MTSTKMRFGSSFVLFLSLLWLILQLSVLVKADKSVGSGENASESTQQCTAAQGGTTCLDDDNANSSSVPEYSVPYRDNSQDPNLREMKFNIGYGEETFLAYVQPDVTTFYKDRDPPSDTPKQPHFRGLAGKFINMSPKHVKLYWDPADGRSDPIAMFACGPFHNEGTAVHPGHHFFFAENDAAEPLVRFTVKQAPYSVYWYDPYLVEGDPETTERNLAVLNKRERELYDKLRHTVLFNEEYLKFTGRSYLANYPRKRPMHFMWPAEYFGQEHWVTTRETHIVKDMPANDKSLDAKDYSRLLQYRSQDEPILNLTLKVLSVAPRVFEITGFLSHTEVDHILQVATDEELSLSSVGTEDELDVRSSFNSWLERDTSTIIDIIYRRAADLMRIDEAMLRVRHANERPELDYRGSAAESLQLVHYAPNQSYNEHHDFGYPYVESPYQSERFATLLFYLNVPESGGTTSFPRWVNAETSEGLKAVPEIGKAVLFYDQLPDGNMDDLSQHAADPVIKGEKWLTNLWTWDPKFRQ